MKLRFSSIQSKFNPQYTILYIFEHTSLIDTSFIPVSFLEECFKYNKLDTSIKIHYWNEENRYKTRDTSYTLKELLQDCDEVKEFAKLYYPEYAI